MTTTTHFVGNVIEYVGESQKILSQSEGNRIIICLESGYQKSTKDFELCEFPEPTSLHRCFMNYGFTGPDGWYSLVP